MTKRSSRFLPRSFWHDLTQAIWQPLFPSLLLVIIICGGFTIGFIYQTQSTLNLQNYGLTHLLGGYLIGINREIIPFFVAIIILLVAGLSYASESANMKSTEQIQLIEMAGIDPVDYLVGPRLIAGIGLTISLTVFGWLSSFIGGCLVCRWMHVDMIGFMQAARSFFQYSFLWIGLLKALVNGIIIGLVPALCGLLLKINHSSDVRRATIFAAALSLILLTVAFFIFSIMIQYSGSVL